MRPAMRLDQVPESWRQPKDRQHGFRGTPPFSNGRNLSVPNLGRALERALADEPDGWDRSKLHVSDTRHALIGEGCPRQLWLRVHGRQAKAPHLGERLMFDHGRRIHERFLKLLMEGLAGSGWQVNVTEHNVMSDLKASGLGIERGASILNLLIRAAGG